MFWTIFGLAHQGFAPGSHCNSSNENPWHERSAATGWNLRVDVRAQARAVPI